MKTVFGMFGGPGTGKTRCSTGAFSDIKDRGVNAEYIPEHVKIKYAWHGKHPEDIDQFSIFGEQTQMEKNLFGQFGPDVILTDSPVWLQVYYAKCHGNDDLRKGFECLVKEYYRMTAERGIKHVHIWLKRLRPYNPKGRFQTEEEAKEIDGLMLPYLQDLGVNFEFCDGTREAVTKFILNHLDSKYLPSTTTPIGIYSGGCY